MVAISSRSGATLARSIPISPEITAWSSNAVVLAPKTHLVTDGNGLPLNIVLSPGQAHENQFAQRL